MTLCWCEKGSVWSASICDSLGPCFLHSASAQGKSPCGCVRQSPPDSERCLPTAQASSSAGQADPGIRCHEGSPNLALVGKENGEIANGCRKDGGGSTEEFRGARWHAEGGGSGREHEVHHAEGSAFIGGGKGDGDNKASIVQDKRDSVDTVPPRKKHGGVTCPREDHIVPPGGDRIFETKGVESEVIRKPKEVLLWVNDRNPDFREQKNEYVSTEEYETSPISISTSSAPSSSPSLTTTTTTTGPLNTAGQQTKRSTGQVGRGPSMDSTGTTTATVVDDGDATDKYEENTSTAAASTDVDSATAGRDVTPSLASLNEGYNVNLTMAGSDVAPESVMWWKDGTVVVNGIVFTPGFVPGIGPMLIMKGINKNHQGVYSCEACVGNLLVIGNVTLPTILAVPVVHIERSSPPQISIACSEPTTLTCCLTSLEGNVTVTWKKGPVPTSSVTAKSLCSNYTHPIRNPCQDTVYTCTFSNEAGATLYAIQVNYIRANDKTCPSNDPWPETKRNGIAHVSCPSGSRGTALRRCLVDGVWGEVFKNCTSKRFTDFKGKVQLMEDGIGNTTEVVPEFLAELKTVMQVPEPSSAEPTLLIGDVRSAHASLDKIIHVASVRYLRFNKVMSKDFLDSASNLLDGSVKESWSKLDIMDSMDSSSLLQTTEDFMHLIDAEAFFSSARNLGSKKSREDFNLSSSNILMAGSLYRASETPTAYHQEFKVDGRTSSVSIDSKAISKLNENSNLTITSMAFTTLSDLLPLRLAPGLASQASSGPPHLGSLVLSTVLNRAQGGGSSGISMNLGLRGVGAGAPLTATPHCSFWDFKLNGSVGGWSTEGCITGNTVDNAVSCICTHTTPFSILRLPETSQGDPTFTIITYVCLSISIAFLIFAVVLESMVLHQNKRYGHKSNGEENDDDRGGHRSLSRGIKLNVLCALLLSHVWFMVAISDSVLSNPTVCSLSQFFLHLSYLCAFSWLLVQAIHLLLNGNGNVVFGRSSRRKVMAATFVSGYGLPILISVITVAATHFSRFYTKPSSCWLNWDGSKALLSLVVPVLLVIAMGLAIAIYILLRARLSDHDGQKRQEGGGLLGDSTTGKAWKLLILMMGLAVIWGVGAYFFMPDGNKIPAVTYLFAVLNALQGVIVVVFNCLLDEEVKRLLNRSTNIVNCEEMKKKDSPFVVSEYDIERNTVDGVYRLQRPDQVACAICGGHPEVSCTECKQPFCRSCDEKQHERLDRKHHERSMNGGQTNVCGVCGRPTEVRSGGALMQHLMAARAPEIKAKASSPPESPVKSRPDTIVGEAMECREVQELLQGSKGMENRR
ncbi:unnamed protein product [Lampetra planeri]